MQVIPEGETLCAAISGGVDSVAMLHALHSLKKWKLIVAHFNHKLRGNDSDEDEKFVREIAGNLSLPIVTGQGDVKVIARETRQSIEMAARNTRHNFLAETALKHNAKIALAHHAGDQVELFFLRLLRGSSATGLGGMEFRGPSPANSNVEIIRPLLYCRKEDIVIAAQKLSFREDSSNEDISILRNAIRKELIPLLERKYQPNLEKVILRTMEILRAEDDLLDSLEGNHAALERRKIVRELQRFGLQPDFEAVEALRRSEKPISIAGKVYCRQGNKVIFVEPINFSPSELRIILNGNSGQATFAGMDFHWHYAKGDGEHFDAESVGHQIKLRHWTPGDRFQMIGALAPSKLQNIFTNLKIPPQERRTRVVAENSQGQIFWVEGLRIGHICRVTPETRQVLSWRWKKRE